ncbi:MAG: sulfotransferase [Gammaproteobacteria bacterium]|nr:sulfotransferase [Gammaproteobacteria bacterium]
MVAQIDKEYLYNCKTRIYQRLLSYALFEGRPLTTKGRWINPIIFIIFSLFKRLPIKKAVKKPIFIVGTGRSGTTILGLILSVHRSVGFLNEPKAIWHSAYGQEDLIGSYSHDTANYRLRSSDATRSVKKSMHRLFGWYLILTRSSRVVDKYPELIFRVPFVKKIFPDAKFLFLVRNGWDTCHSIRHWSERLGEQKHGEIHDWWGVNNRKWKLLVEQLISEHPRLAAHAKEISGFTRHTDMAAVEWIITMREGLRLQAEYPEDVHTVIYEDLCLETSRTLTALREFCELTIDKKFDEYAKKTLHPIKSKLPFELHPAIQAEFNAVMHELGYSNG